MDNKQHSVIYNYHYARCFGIRAKKKCHAFKQHGLSAAGCFLSSSQCSVGLISMVNMAIKTLWPYQLYGTYLVLSASSAFYFIYGHAIKASFTLCAIMRMFGRSFFWFPISNRNLIIGCWVTSHPVEILAAKHAIHIIRSYKI